MSLTKKHKLVLLIAILIAISSTILLLAVKPDRRPRLHYKCFKTAQGWGYDVLVNDSIFIHQPFIPGIAGYNAFPTEKEAAADAESVIEKIKAGEMPSF